LNLVARDRSPHVADPFETPREADKTQNKSELLGFARFFRAQIDC
jgi:hypothetical protein